MMRVILLATALLLSPCAAHAETAQDPAKALKELQAFSIERAKLAVKLRELTNFARFYEQKKEKLAADAKELEKEQTALGVEKRRVDARCEQQPVRGKRAMVAAAEKCQSYRAEFDARLAKFNAMYKSVHGELASIGKAEKERKAGEEETSRLLDEANKLIPALEKMVQESKEKECILACNAKPPLEMEPCLQACLPAEDPAKQ